MIGTVQATVTAWVVALVHALQATEASHFIKVESWWVWPTLETLHFTGMSILIGTVGLFDLRVLGLARSIPPGALHRLVPWGIGAYLLNLATGILFFVGNPDQYAFNLAFHFKLSFMALAGLNLMLFYGTAYAGVRDLPAGADAPVPAKVMTAVSLFAWLSVIVCGRLLTWFRPVFFG
jgi:hypothetical protein